VNDQVQKIIENGVEWAAHEFNMTQDEVIALLEQNGKAPCNACARVQDAASMDENGMCRRCGCATCHD
jgi:hypothetical protein